MSVQIVAWAFRRTLNGVQVDSSLPLSDEAESPIELLEILCQEREHTLNLTWTLDADIAPVLKFLGETICRQLYDTEESKLKNFKITYKQGKVFSILDWDTGNLAEYYSLEQFLPDFPRPEPLEQLYQWGRMVHKTIQEVGLNPVRMVSIGNIFANGILKTLNIPTWRDLPEKVAEYALYCAKRQWVEALAVGYFENTVDMDLRQAYPSRMVDLADTRYCTWSQWKGVIPKEAVYGYFKCALNINKAVRVHPFMTYINDQPMNPTGQIPPDYYTLNGLRFFDEHRAKLGSYEILDGVYCVPNRPDFHQYQMSYPLRTILPRLMAKRTKFDAIKDLVVKVGISAMGGYLSMVTTRDGKEILGDWCNPCWAAEFTTDTRLEVARFIYRHNLERKALHISVDGNLIEGTGPLLTPIDTAAGWRQSYEGPALILSGGRVFIGKKRPGGMTLGQAMGMVQADPDNASWHTTETRRMTLGEALQDGQFARLGEEITTKQTLHCFASHKRYFRQTPKNGHELLSKQFTSVPYHLEVKGA